MRQRRLTSLLFLLIFVICGGNSTTETIEPVEDATKVNTSTTNEATKEVEDNNQVDTKAVSYTHLTLPTIYSV